MSKLNVNQELAELITRFRQLKKAIAEEDRLTPAQRAVMEAANQFSSQMPLRKTKVDVEQQKAQQLANTLQRAGILGNRPLPQQPSSADQETWLRNNGFQTEDMLKSQEAAWGNSINNWLTEASKPINSRFASSAEEKAYWDSIKISGGSGGNEGSGY